MRKRYRTVQDLMLDDQFCQWVVGKAELETVAYWEAWLTANPDKEELVRQAKLLLLDLNSPRESLQPPEQVEIWTNIQRRIDSGAGFSTGDKPQRQAEPAFYSSWRFISGVAAGLAAVLVVGLAFFWLTFQKAG